jgi:acyl-CoA thioester hydrolase
MGRVYYANFLVYFEVGRTHLIRAHWKPYTELEKEGYLLPVLKAACEYHHPVGYDDLIQVETHLTLPRHTLLHFDYIATDPERSLLVAEGYTEHCFIHPDGRPRRVPPELYRMIKDSGSDSDK